MSQSQRNNVIVMQYKKETDHWSVSREESMKKIYQKNLLLFF